MKRRSAGDDRRQLLINWSDRSAGKSSAVSPSMQPESAASAESIGSPAQEVSPLVQRLPWDFRNTFPEPTPEAIEAGEIAEEDVHPDNIRSIHEEHAREALSVLHDLDAVLDARRLGVDPRNRKKPTIPAAQERLRKFFATEPQRLERWLQTLMDTYESAFGVEAADAFGKTIRAWHAGIEVAAETKPVIALADTRAVKGQKPKSTLFAETHPPGRRKRIVARLPVPRPLPSAVAAGHFGQEDDGQPVRPGAHEVREITERHAAKLIELLDSISADPLDEKETLLELFQIAIAGYAKDFGAQAADQLEAYVRRQAELDPTSRRER